MTEQNEEEVYELSDLEIDAVGLVGKAANRRKYLLYKSDKTTEEETVSENTETPIENLDGVVEQLESVEDVGGIKKAFQSFLQWFGGQQVEKGDTEPEPETEPEPVQTPDPAIEELRKATAEMREALEKAQKRAEEAEKIAIEERDRRVTQEYIAKAEGLAIPGEVKELATLLKKADEAGIGDGVYDILEATSNAIMTSGIFVEKGTTQMDEDTGHEFLKAVEDRKAELRKADVALTDAEAFTQAYLAIGNEQPDLAAKYIASRERETGRK